MASRTDLEHERCQDVLSLGSRVSRVLLRERRFDWGFFESDKKIMEPETMTHRCRSTAFFDPYVGS